MAKWRNNILFRLFFVVLVATIGGICHARNVITCYCVVDDLLLAYEGKRLVSADDAAEPTAHYGATDFRDGVKDDTEYRYDANGNMTRDLNRGIDEITYDRNNRPMSVRFLDGRSTEYVYDSDGQKLRVSHYGAGGDLLSQTDYIGDCVLRDGKLWRMLLPTGYMENDTVYTFVRDFQGNVRLVVREDGEVAESNEYYPYGMLFDAANSVQPYKYGGKELDRTHGLDWYDFGARMLDPTLARWTSPDPLSEKYYHLSPYAYCAGNPVKYIDPNGGLIIFVNGFQPSWPFESSQAYWNGFDKQVLKHFNDTSSPIYLDGALDSYLSIGLGKDSNLNPQARYADGYITGGKKAASIITSLKRDANGIIIEPLRIVTHSMGGLFGKGFAQAIVDYALKNPDLANGLSISEYDFAPFQPYYQTAVNGVDTFQYSHNNDNIAGASKISGATYKTTSDKESDGHSINSFFQYIKYLPTGKYKFINGHFEKTE